MIFVRFFLILFNVSVVTFLIYRLIQVSKMPISTGKKAVIVVGGIFLLLVPFAMLFRFIPPTMQYFLVYPVAISAFIFLIKDVSSQSEPRP